jgi:hypothetical protein
VSSLVVRLSTSLSCDTFEERDQGGTRFYVRTTYVAGSGSRATESVLDST